MRKIIKLTERQLREAQEGIFQWNTGSEVENCSGNSKISVSGKLNDNEMGKPVDSDYVEDELTPQGYGRYWHGYGNFYGALHQVADYDPLDLEDKDGTVSEEKKKSRNLINELSDTPDSIAQVSLSTNNLDSEGNAERPSLNVDSSDSTFSQQIPASVLAYFQKFLESMSRGHLNYLKQATLLKAMIEKMDFSKYPGIKMKLINTIRNMGK